MTTYRFTLILLDHHYMSEDMAEALYEAGCDDALPHSGDGIVGVDFDREAPTLEAAIRSAVADVKRAGFTVHHIEMEPEALSLPA